MTQLIKYFAIILLILITSANAQNSGLKSKVFYQGETLVYKVKWMFIRIGTITIRTFRYEKNPDCVKVIMEVESNPDLFFVKAKEYNESIINGQNFMSESYYGDHDNGSERLIIESNYNKESRTAVYSTFDYEKKIQIKSFLIKDAPSYVEGPSLFFFTGVNASPGNVINIPTLVNGKIANTRIVYGRKKEELEIDALPYPIKTIHYFGCADWEGGTSQGLGGEFEGWLSDDDAKIPVYAELKVLLGSIKLELESWKRDRWNSNYLTDFNK